jgi:hypothetical protein
MTSGRCTVIHDGCACLREVYARGMCAYHYWRNREYGSPTAPGKREVRAAQQRHLATIREMALATRRARHREFIQKSQVPILLREVEPTPYIERLQEIHASRVARREQHEELNREFRRLLVSGADREFLETKPFILRSVS